ncbi:MAG: DUF4352 domain-containing protein [Acidobacteriaceae bacterium]
MRDWDDDEREGANSGTILLGYACCVVALFFLPPAFAIAAFIVGIVVLVKGSAGHGVALIVLSVTCGIAGIVIGAAVWTNDLGSLFQGKTASVRTQQVESAQEQTLHAIGDSFSVGYWSYRCNGARWQSMLVTDYGSMMRPDAAFLIVDMTIRNDDRTESTRPQMKLVDSQGREFSESSSTIELSNSLDILEQLNPSVSTRGYVLFDAPPEGKYVLRLSGGFESARFAYVDLPTAQNQTTTDSQ